MTFEEAYRIIGPEAVAELEEKAAVAVQHMTDEQRRIFIKVFGRNRGSAAGDDQVA